MSYETAKVLQDAAAVLERDGWAQGDYQTPNGYCALGAIGVASNGYEVSPFGPMVVPSDGPADPAIKALLGHLGFWTDSQIPAWNDEPGRTKQEVIDAFHKAAKREMRKADGISD